MTDHTNEPTTEAADAAPGADVAWGADADVAARDESSAEPVVAAADESSAEPAVAADESSAEPVIAANDEANAEPAATAESPSPGAVTVEATDADADARVAAATAWGRVAEDGTVYVRTADGERAVGSWQAGDAAAGLAHFARRYDELATRVRLLRERLEAATIGPGQATSAAKELRESLPTATVVGDLAALEQQLTEIDALIGERRKVVAAARSKVTDRRRSLVEEAETLASSTHWKAAGDRLQAIVEEWKTAGEGDRRAEDALWKRLSAARRRFGDARKSAFREREASREQARAAKEQLIAEAESLTGSTDWAETSRRYRDLMTAWKAAGRAGRDDEEKLWARFRSAQDAFFEHRAQAYASRDDEFRGNLTRKEELLARAEAIDPSKNLAGAQNALRAIQDEWDKIGRVPRGAMQKIDARLRAVEDRIREASDAQWRRPSVRSNPLLDQMRRACDELAERVASAHSRGDAKAADRLERELAGKRELLEHAEASLRR